MATKLIVLMFQDVPFADCDTAKSDGFMDLKNKRSTKTPNKYTTRHTLPWLYVTLPPQISRIDTFRDFLIFFFPNNVKDHAISFPMI